MNAARKLTILSIIIFFAFLFVPSETANSLITDKAVKVNIGNESDGGSSNLAGAEMELYEGYLDYSKEPMKKWVTEKFCKTFYLNPGTYTLKVSKPPEGYEFTEPLVFKIENEIVYVEDDDDAWTPRYPEKRPDEGNKYYGYYYRYNLTQEPMMYIYPEGYRDDKDKHSIVYCFNHEKEGTPAGPANGKNEWRYYVKLEDASQWNQIAEHPRFETYEEFQQDIMRVILNGFPRNISGLKGSMSDGDFYEATQIAVWYYTDSIPLDKWRYADFYNVAKKAAVVDMAERIVEEEIHTSMEEITLNIYLPRGDIPKKYQSLIGTDTVIKDKTKEYSITIFNKKRPEKQTIEIGKVDKDEWSLAGAELQVLDKRTGEVVHEWTSTSDKAYHAVSLYPGEYIVKEVKAPNEYIPISEFSFSIDEQGHIEIIDKEDWDVIKTRGQNARYHEEIQIFNYKKTGKVWLTIGKVTGSGQDPSTISGAKMRITNINGDIVHEWITGGYEYVEVFPGIYYIEEIEPPAGGYKAVKPVKFSIDKEGHIKIIEKTDITDEVYGLWKLDSEGNWTNTDKNGYNTIRVYNHKEPPEKVIMRIGKLDKIVTSGVHYTIPGATFELLDPKTREPIIFDYSENYYHLTGGWGWVERKEWTTERAKSYNAIRVDPGEYILHEKKAPEGFVPVSDIRFRIYAGGTIEIMEKDERDEIELYWPGGKSANELKIVDRKAPDSGYKVTFEKIGEYTKAPIEGAQLQILDETGNKIVKEWKSKEKPQSFYLDYGIYIFREIIAPKGYREVKDVYFKVNQYGELEIIKKLNPRDEVTITNKYEGRRLNKKTVLSKLSITDKRKDFNFYVRKEDSKNGRFLPDAEFKLYKEDVNTGKWEYLRTDKTSRSTNLSDRGLIYYADYMPGKYKLQETKAPPGYNIIRKDIVFILKEDGEINVISPIDDEIRTYESGTILVSNKRGYKLPDSGGDSYTGKIVIVGILMLTVGLSLIYREKNKPEINEKEKKNEKGT